MTLRSGCCWRRSPHPPANSTPDAYTSAAIDNYYEFDQDFVVESSGCGVFGCGTLTRQAVGGKYRLVAQGEGHGVIRFVGDVASLSWQTHHGEDWQGFTLGAYGVSPVPEPASVALSLAGLALIGWRLRRSAAWGRSSSGCCLR